MRAWRAAAQHRENVDGTFSRSTLSTVVDWARERVTVYFLVIEISSHVSTNLGRTGPYTVPS